MTKWAADLDRNSIARITRITPIVTLFTAAVTFALGGGSAAQEQAKAAPRDTRVVLGGFGSVLVTFSMVVYCMIGVSLRDHTPKPRLVIMAGFVLVICAPVRCPVRHLGARVRPLTSIDTSLVGRVQGVPRQLGVSELRSFSSRVMTRTRPGFW